MNSAVAVIIAPDHSVRAVVDSAVQRLKLVVFAVYRFEITSWIYLYRLELSL